MKNLTLEQVKNLWSTHCGSFDIDYDGYLWVYVTLVSKDGEKIEYSSGRGAYVKDMSEDEFYDMMTDENPDWVDYLDEVKDDLNQKLDAYCEYRGEEFEPDERTLKALDRIG